MKPPPLTIKTTPGVPPIHELEGWDELNQWGEWNHPHWASIQRRLEWAEGMSEIDKLRLLAGEMLRLNVSMMDSIIAGGMARELAAQDSESPTRDNG